MNSLLISLAWNVALCAVHGGRSSQELDAASWCHVPGITVPVVGSSSSIRPGGMYILPALELILRKLCKVIAASTRIVAFSGARGIIDLKILHRFARIPKPFSDMRRHLESL